jgi:putative membrane protein
MKRNPFTKEEEQRIAEAVKRAESKTSGEIVPYWVSSADNFEAAYFKSALAFAILPTVYFGVSSLQWGFDSLVTPFETTLWIAGFSLVGLALAFLLPAWRRLLVGKEAIENQVAKRAAQAFVAEEVFDTRERTGVLIFVADFERTVLVVGDSGVNAKAEPDEWKGIADRFAREYKSGGRADALVNAVNRCGDILERVGVERRADDENELGNALRTGE